MTADLARANDLVADLTPVEYHCVRNLCYNPRLPAVIEAIAVGWLGDAVITSGPLSPDALDAMRYAHVHNDADEGWLGYHTCGICHAYDDRGEFLIETAGRIYVMPKMLVHYIDAHQYRPPQEFLDHVIAWWEHTRRNADPRTASDRGSADAGTPEK